MAWHVNQARGILIPFTFWIDKRFVYAFCVCRTDETYSAHTRLTVRASSTDGVLMKMVACRSGGF